MSQKNGACARTSAKAWASAWPTTTSTAGRIIFVTNDASYNSLFHNLGNKFEEVAFETGVALTEDGAFISGMGLDFRDFNNDGYPDIAFVALNNQTFPLFQNTGKGDFREVTTRQRHARSQPPDVRLRRRALRLRQRWMERSCSSAGATSNRSRSPVSRSISRTLCFAILGASGKWQALTEEAGFNAAPAARHRGCAFGDFDGDGRVDVVVTALGADAEIWMNRSQKSGHWLDIALQGTKSNRDGIGARIKVTSKSGTQYNHMTTSVGYASSSDGPVHFGLGPDSRADVIEIQLAVGNGADAKRHPRRSDTKSNGNHKVAGAPFLARFLREKWGFPGASHCLASHPRIRRSLELLRYPV